MVMQTVPRTHAHQDDASPHALSSQKVEICPRFCAEDWVNFIDDVDAEEKAAQSEAYQVE